MELKKLNEYELRNSESVKNVIKLHEDALNDELKKLQDNYREL